jgi:hypothetical protein
MCINKISFRNRDRAERSAAIYGQRIYECPICFCWHCTSKENWQDEFVDAITAKRQMAAAVSNARAEIKQRLKAKNVKISELEREISRLRKLVPPPETNVEEGK